MYHSLFFKIGGEKAMLALIPIVGLPLAIVAIMMTGISFASPIKYPILLTIALVLLF